MRTVMPKSIMRKCEVALPCFRSLARAPNVIQVLPLPCPDPHTHAIRGEIPLHIETR